MKPFSTSTTSIVPAAFSRIVDKTSVPAWNFLISDLAHSHNHFDSLLAFSALRRLSLIPDRSTFPPTFKSATNLVSIAAGRQLHLLSFVLGLTQDLFVSSSLINMYSRCGCLDDARKVFDESSIRNVVVYTAMSGGFMANGKMREGVRVFKDMIGEVGCGIVDGGAVVGVLSACGKLPSAKRLVYGVHGLVIKLGLNEELGVANTLIDAYAKGKEVKTSRKVFDEMPEKDVVSWNTIVAVYAQNGFAGEALELYLEMLQKGEVRYNAVTLSSILFACAHEGSLQIGKCVHDQVIRMGLEENVYVGTSVVDMYCKCGRVEMARKAFSRMKEKNIKSWSAMIAGYGMHGLGEEALKIFSDMLENEIKPNHITFVSVLAACSHSGLLQDGRHWFRSMKDDYGIEPTVEHYGCIVDLLGRAGCLDEAYNLIKDMRIEPDFMIWGALLSACRIHKNVKLGELCANMLFELDPKNCGYYVLLSNIYADAGRWKDVESMRVLIKSRGIVKPPGYSMVELKGKRHVFMVGDRIHLKHEEIYRYLENLRIRLKEAGYVPDTGSVLHDVDEEEKETTLRVHSEKLAVAFAILNTVPGSSILIIKNLRVCGDCHLAIKFIAKMERREIVVRDSHRFHHFRDGTCSCGDYW